MLKMLRSAVIVLLLTWITYTNALRFDPDHVGWNLNENETAIDPLDYWGEWKNHTFHPSPSNWRFPFYVLTIDRYVDGDPTNNEANGTNFEHDWMSNQFRFGGDAKGLMNNLDYIQGMGVKGLYLSGSLFINEPWGTDGFGPLDLTLLDHHHGVIQDWRNLITEIHRRDMYIILDNTLATMGDLFSFKGHENDSAPFNWKEYDMFYKTGRQYLDFHQSNDHNASCKYPRIWNEKGFPMDDPVILEAMAHGCKDSEFDQYGDMTGVGYVPVEQTQLAKFASVQDRLRTWRNDVLEKLMHFSCMQIAMLDIDGWRVDKAAQTPIDIHSRWSTNQRECARRYGKENFLIVGEIVGKNAYESLFVGRGKQPDMAWTNETEAVLAMDITNSSKFVHPAGQGSLDGAAFHYPTYGAMTRFLGLDGPIGLEGVDFVDIWHKLLQTQDMVNSNTGLFDPRHMFGMTNQDVFRWPSLVQGTHRHLLGLFITVLQMPGIPFHLWGEEQEYSVHENQAADYVFGRTPMASSRAWQIHGCYKLGEEVYVDMPFDSALNGCNDDRVSLDHRDPSHPLRNIIKRMYELRRQYPVLNEGVELQTLSAHTYDKYLHGSLGMPSPTGLWSVYRGRHLLAQNFIEGKGNQSVWFVYHNENRTVKYDFSCQNRSSSLLAAFDRGTTVKNLFYPYEEYVLKTSATRLGIDFSSELSGCLTSLELAPFEFKAFVPIDKWAAPGPTITKLLPSHDSRLISSTSRNQAQTVPLEIHFSKEMNCVSVLESVSIQSTTEFAQTARLNKTSVNCEIIYDSPPGLVAGIPSAWVFRAELENVFDGIHRVTVNNPLTEYDNLRTEAVDHFIFRIGQKDNPMVFHSANYTTDLLHRDPNTRQLYISPKAAGANKWQYSLTWGTKWSEWLDYSSENSTLKYQIWHGTKEQLWEGEHVVVRYWSEIAGSMEHVQHGDLDHYEAPRRWPHMHVVGPWNAYGYDSGLSDKMVLGSGGWSFKHMEEWPSEIILSTWGIGADGQPDKSKFFGDVDGDNILDWLAPKSLGENVINITAPPMPFIGYKIVANDADYRYFLEPTGSAWRQLTISTLLALLPLMTGFAAVYGFRKSFYHVKFNQAGALGHSRDNCLPTGFLRISKAILPQPAKNVLKALRDRRSCSINPANPQREEGFATIEGENRRTVLIATMEYEIEDWKMKIKIGGLGVMASLMGKHLKHQNLIWVVPCVGDLTYPIDRLAEPMEIVIMNQSYHILVQHHRVENITFVLLDAPIFRSQSKTEPYPARMDDMASAIYYSAWNQCIAETIRRFPEIEMYHINDYHGALAPLYLLGQNPPPCCLSLHNAEFQGLWSIRTQAELDEISSIFNLNKDVIRKYVQFGDVFNLLHGGASYLRLHQNGFGAVGVSKKYGKRSYARYPIFWGLSKIGSLPNPDPSDTAEWNEQDSVVSPVTVDTAQEGARGHLRCLAQEWAGLKKDPKAELFVFVGRWSMQKGIDLIADVFPAILEKNSRAQLICVGPVIDLYGKFAALKLQKLMETYPDRVFSKPEFTVLPPFVFSGAEFALIPSRDEPFGLVAVEFGRKGALGIGSRVGGLGQMPGWWFTIESVATRHLVRQFKTAIKNALASSHDTRVQMRARSLVQRFPVSKWVDGLEKLQNCSMAAHQKFVQSPAKVLISGFSDGSFPSPWATSNITSIQPVLSGNNLGSTFASRSPSPTRMGPEPPDEPFRFDVRQSQKATSARPSPYPTVVEDREGYFDRIVPIQNNPSSNNSISETAEHPIESPRPTLITNFRPRGIASPANSATWTPVSSGPTSPWPISRRPSLLSMTTVVGDEKNFYLQKVDPFFTDSQGYYYKEFEKRLKNLDGQTSESELCIEDFLRKSEKSWYERLQRAKLGFGSASPTPVSSVFNVSIEPSAEPSANGSVESFNNEEFQLHEGHSLPSKLQRFMQFKFNDWPIYSLFVALGQILAANSYQITLLTGEIGQSATKLYVVASIYLGSTMIWWCLFRRLKSFYIISIPFAIYGAAFLILGMSPYGKTVSVCGWIQNLATGLYAVASGSGSLFFALNFGTEGGTDVRTWLLRASVIQGAQQAYVTVLWLWGSHLATLSSSGVRSSTMVTATPVVTGITTVIALILFGISLVLYLGLPNYYHSTPGSIPSFYSSIWRRKIVVWFFIVVVIQNYFLSAPYGRNWRYLWASSIAPTWAIACLAIFFFIVVWAGAFKIFSHLANEHTWILPIFAMGIGAPRWAQMLWGTSGIGLWIPWAPTPVIGAVLGRSLWLWLGVLDALQGVGFGMVLLQTLTRFHIAFTLMAAQVVGSLATIAARASAPNKIGPGTVFPNFALSLGGLSECWFWITLIFQGIVCIGFFAFFRKEQLFKP